MCFFPRRAEGYMILSLSLFSFRLFHLHSLDFSNNVSFCVFLLLLRPFPMLFRRVSNRSGVFTTSQLALLLWSYVSGLQLDPFPLTITSPFHATRGPYSRNQGLVCSPPPDLIPSWACLFLFLFTAFLQFGWIFAFLFVAFLFCFMSVPLVFFYFVFFSSSYMTPYPSFYFLVSSCWLPFRPFLLSLPLVDTCPLGTCFFSVIKSCQAGPSFFFFFFFALLRLFSKCVLFPLGCSFWIPFFFFHVAQFPLYFVFFLFLSPSPCCVLPLSCTPDKSFSSRCLDLFSPAF